MMTAESKKDQLITIAKLCGNFGRLDLDTKNPDTTSLWVVFSHVNIPKGKFGQSNVMGTLDGHKLYLNCSDNDWYTRGVSKFSSSLPSTINNLLALSNRFKITFVGHSMGAYLSLVAGRSQSNVRYISTSPELKLGIGESRSSDNGVSSDGPWRDISKIDTLIKDGNRNGVTYFGVYDPIDCYFLAQDTVDHIGQIYEVPHHHGVTEYFTGNGIYHDILQAEVGSEIFTTLQNREHLYPIGHHGTKAQYEHFYKTYVTFKKKGAPEQLRSMVSKYANWNNPGWQEVRSKIWGVLKEPHLAMDAAEQAYQYQPNLMQFIDTYGLTCIKNGEKSRAINLLDSLTKNQRAHPIGNRLLERVNDTFGNALLTQVTIDLEYRAVPVRISRQKNRISLPSETRPKNSSELHKMNMARQYDEVLEITSPLKNESFRYDVQLAPARAVALVQQGNMVAGLRLLRALSERGHNDRFFARAVIASAVIAKNVSLVEMYLRLNLNAKYCEIFSKFLIQALKFVRSPMLVAQILAELGKHHSKSLEETFKSLTQEKELGYHYVVARLIPNMVDHADINEMHRLDFVQYMVKAGLRHVAFSWLPDESRTEEEAKIMNGLQLEAEEPCINTDLKE